MSKEKSYMVYKSDALIACGTAKEVAEQLNITVSCVHSSLSHYNKRRTQGKCEYDCRKWYLMEE